MGWVKGRKNERGGRPVPPPGVLTVAAVLAGAQLPAAGVLWLIGTFGRDDYGAGSGPALGVFCLIVVSPLLLPLLGLVQACALTLPSLALARAANRRLGGPAWRTLLVAPVLPASFWGAVTALLWRWPPFTSIPLLTALGILPTLAVPWVHGRGRRAWGLWWRAALGSAALAVVTLGAGALALVTGLIEEYRPPELTPAQLVGVWRDGGGAQLRLYPGGRAEAVRVPAQPTGDDFGVVEYVMCGGSGAWETDDDGRPGIVLHPGGGCGAETHWSVTGTASSPALFSRFGEPDAGTLWRLDRAGN